MASSTKPGRPRKPRHKEKPPGAAGKAARKAKSPGKSPKAAPTRARSSGKVAATKSGPAAASAARPRAARPGGQAAPIPTLAFADRGAWARWLAANHASSAGLWLKVAKKASGAASVTYPEALEVALAWGWIDGQKGALDDAWWLQKFTPRGRRSIWSKINRDKALALIEAGEMKPAGLAEVERARRDGRWAAAYDSPRASVVPDDLAAALAASPRARDFFATLDSRNRYAILFRIHNAVKSQTRADRIARFVAMLARGDKLYP